MHRSIFAVVLSLIAVTAHAQSWLARERMNIYAIGGKSITTWHGQADVQLLNVEFRRQLSPRYELSTVVAPANIWQPRSWFGAQYGDGNEAVRAISGSVLLRRHFFADSRIPLFAEASTGPLWAERRVPASTSRFNFITQLGAGAVLFHNKPVGLLVGYRFLHISNGGYAPRNPGLNVHSLMLGARFRAR